MYRLLLLFKNSRLLLLLLSIFSYSCHSTGQQNKKESDWWGKRTIPAYVTEDLPASPELIFKNASFEWYRFGAVDSVLASKLINKQASQFQEILQYTDKQLDTKPLKFYFYPSSETKGLKLQNSSPCQINFDKNEVHLVVNDFFSDHYLAQANELLIYRLLGPAQTTGLQQGLAIYFSKNWQKYGFKHWAGRLAQADQLPDLEDLLDKEVWDYRSDLIYGSAAAALVDFLIEESGKASFLETYTHWVPTESERTKLEKSWKQHCLMAVESTLSAKLQSIPYFKGFNFAHEGYRIYNGYGSKKAEQALVHLKNMQSNAIAIVPYSFSRYPKRPHPIPVAKRAGSENDESVIQSAEVAQSLGLSVILKPQIWVGRGMWTGDIEMSSDQDWESFFDQYGHWISHYAIMAEIYEWESLCIGTELVQTTLKRDHNWRKLIRSLRSLYSGSMTYAANWGDEFEKTTFWDELDYIGLNCYYPLSQKDGASDKDLMKGFRAVIDKIKKVHQRYQKPIVFTEIGFPSIEQPWKKPHEDWGDFEVNVAHQSRCYEVVFKSIQNQAWCKGILWWKYPSDLMDKRKKETGFTPHGKMAEGVVADWFDQLQQ